MVGKKSRGYYKPKYKKPSVTTTQKFKQTMDRKIKKLESKIKKLEKEVKQSYKPKRRKR